MSFTRTLLAASALLASAVNAHVAMTNPVPYGHPDTSPLNPSGSNYPCKTDNGFTINSVTSLVAGGTTKLAFTGTAVHNGGSCQISLTPGHAPTTDSSFKVIYTIEGGCPGTNGQTTTYDVPIPKDAVPDGEYSLAWTWYNNIGNREIYMNCAPVTVSGSSGTQASMAALPDMAIFNIPSKNSCGTVETFDVAFPNPGDFGTTGAGYKPTPPSNCGAKAAASAPAAGGAPAGGASSAAAAAPAAPSVASGGSGQGPAAGGSSPTATSTIVYTQTSTVVAGSAATGAGVFGENPGNYTGSVTTSVLASAGPAVPAATGAANMPAGISSVQSCSTNGALQCSPDGSLQGLCNFGQAMMMPVAAGTKCVNGAIMKRSAKFLNL